MSCAGCHYYEGELRCGLHGALDDLARWLRCDDYLDRDAEYRGKVGGGCGIYNYPWPGVVIPTQVSPETSRPGPF